MGLDHLLMRRPADSFIFLVSRGCLNNIMTARPIPLVLSVSYSNITNVISINHASKIEISLKQKNKNIYKFNL